MLPVKFTSKFGDRSAITVAHRHSELVDRRVSIVEGLDGFIVRLVAVRARARVHRERTVCAGQATVAVLVVDDALASDAVGQRVACIDVVTGQRAGQAELFYCRRTQRPPRSSPTSPALASAGRRRRSGLP